MQWNACALRYLLGMTVPIVLVATGITLLLFGALILLKFPDKPGGTIEAKAFGQGFHISSIGAGLPIIVVGAILLISAAFVPKTEGEGPSPVAPPPSPTSRTDKDITTSPAPPTPISPTGPSLCPEQLLAEVKEERTKTMEVGADDQTVVGSSQSLTEEFGIKLTSDGQLVGAILLRYFPDSQLFKIGGIVDSKCHRVEDFSNASDPGQEKHILQNYQSVQIRLNGILYFLHLGINGEVKASFSTRMQS